MLLALQILLIGFILFYATSSFVAHLTSDKWWVRVFDFPRLQLATLGVMALALYIALFRDPSWLPFALIGLSIFALGLDVYRVAPYTIFVPIESQPSERAREGSIIRLLSSNVLQTNQQFGLLVKRIFEADPDIVFLVEVNERWLREIQEIERNYPHFIKAPQENTYGAALYSRFPLESAELKFLEESDIPSIHAKIKLPAGQLVQLFGLHPRPPQPRVPSTAKRDAELIQIAKLAKKSNLPVIVLGDLNDVAWSHTTRLFRRISRLLDPRVGRGQYPTHPTHPAFMRFPIDHMFHSNHFRILDLRTLDDIHSDHLPFFTELSFEPEGSSQQEAPSPQKTDEADAHKILKRA